MSATLHLTLHNYTKNICIIQSYQQIYEKNNIYNYYNNQYHYC